MKAFGLNDFSVTDFGLQYQLAREILNSDKVGYHVRRKTTFGDEVAGFILNSRDGFLYYPLRPLIFAGSAPSYAMEEYVEAFMSGSGMNYIITSPDKGYAPQVLTRGIKNNASYPAGGQGTLLIPLPYVVFTTY